MNTSARRRSSRPASLDALAARGVVVKSGRGEESGLHGLVINADGTRHRRRRPAPRRRLEIAALKKGTHPFLLERIDALTAAAKKGVRPLLRSREQRQQFFLRRVALVGLRHLAAALRDVRVRSDVRLTEVPAPTRIAPYAAALTADVIDPADPEDELATGRFVLLHDPAGPDTWAGTWRVVTFARAALEPELAGDPMLSAVGWSWLTDSLKGRALTWTAEAGTVTRVVSESFGGLADRAASVEMEIRASWTPVRGALTEHLRAWADLLCTIAGIPPLPDGVVPLPGQRR